MDKAQSFAAAVLGLAMLGALAGPASAQEPSAVNKTVVELFTSQGCSSCPPADALLRELSKRPDVIALSIHVNYWDYIGWKDPFATEETTARQHAYARALHQRYVYTPEMVIDGFAGVTGSRESEVTDLISKAATRERLRLAVTAEPTADGKLKVSVPAGAGGTQASVWLFVIDTEHVTEVARGENGGRTLTNAHVVRAVRKLGVWTGAPLELIADLPAAPGGGDACAIVVQADEAGPVIGSAFVAMR